ncbi:extracellular solute-binding protein [Streptomyces ureilyticus]|uniref:Extracellular solute-binding protein n=1 Tax=Streptomyces ureilyticus TaxID=1775131 RepID=A0ABX0DNK6_9ACTN|nr:extracellular solute-binding protein [Streptomyces ureilyticus]NGO42290.1 extracellular solute-binding protein [Streptomyces ureilyticus]
MHAHPGAPPSRRRFLALAAGGAAAGAAALSGCALSTAGAAPGGSESVTMMVNLDDVSPELVKQAQKEIGVKITIVAYDITRLIAMLTNGNPPDLVRGLGALDAPYFAARDVAENLDPYFAKSTVLKVDDLDPANDLWRFDGTTQGKGPRYGMAKDFSQDAMFWYNTAHFDKAGVDYPSDTDPITYEEWLDNAKRLVQRKNGQTTVYGGSYNGLGLGILFTNLTAAAGGSLFSDDFSRVDFTSPEARRALTWYVDYAKTRVGPSLIQPNPDAWDGPTYVASRMAMSGSGYWLGGMINAEAKVAEVSRLAPAPVFEGGPRISACQGGTGMWMPKKARNKDAAWRVFEWFFGEAPAKARAEGGWGIPTLKSLQSLMPDKEDYQKRVLEVQRAELKHFSVTPFTPYIKTEAIDAIINQIIPAAMNGQLSVDTLAGRLNSSVNEQMKRGKEQVG